MTDREALLRGVLDHPVETVRRMVYADWLLEHGDRPGDQLRGEFIQVQAEIHDLTTRWELWSGDQERRQDALIRREMNLMHKMNLVGGLDNGLGMKLGYLIRNDLTPYAHRNDDGTADDNTLSFHLGFGRVACVTARNWFGGVCHECHGSGHYEKREFVRNVPFNECPTRHVKCECRNGQVIGLGPYLVAHHPIAELRLCDSPDQLHSFLTDEVTARAIKWSARRVQESLGLLDSDDMVRQVIVAGRIAKPLLKWARRTAGLEG